ncbi:histone H3.Y-like [Armigeres subalbatus]|uniref:histone H3.Y-like n=1 Tax=Armigeres subalbatus TaxID=124917 RepID=UPI002ED0F0F7
MEDSDLPMSESESEEEGASSGYMPDISSIAADIRRTLRHYALDLNESDLPVAESTRIDGYHLANGPSFPSEIEYCSRPVITRALQEIMMLQHTTGLLIPRKPFKQLVRFVADAVKPGLRFTREADDIIQEAAEIYLIELLNATNMCASHANRITIRPDDVGLALDIGRY